MRVMRLGAPKEIQGKLRNAGGSCDPDRSALDPNGKPGASMPASRRRAARPTSTPPAGSRYRIGRLSAYRVSRSSGIPQTAGFDQAGSGLARAMMRRFPTWKTARAAL
jgi:hypothetical protein